MVGTLPRPDQYPVLSIQYSVGQTMQVIKPSTRRLIWEFSGRDADLTHDFRDELAQWVRVMWRLYGHRQVREYTVKWAMERFAAR